MAGSYRWLAAEHTGLAVSLERVWREGLGRLGQALTSLLADFFEVYVCSDEWEQTHEVALRAARLAGGRHAEASLLRGLGDLRRCQDRLPEAVAHFTRSNVSRLKLPTFFRPSSWLGASSLSYFPDNRSLR